MNAELKLAVVRFLIITTCFGMITFSCGDERPDLIGCWTHFYEEGQNIYKECNSQEFGPSRFRQVYDFKPDGLVTYRELQPGDGYLEAEGRWELLSNRSEVQIRDVVSNELLIKLRFTVINRSTIELVEIP